MIVAEKKKKQGRNDSCGCGSGRKYKKCCGGTRRTSENQNLRLSSQIQEAVRLHTAGDLDAAEKIYRRVLSWNKKNVDALHMLGAILCQRKEYELSIELIQQAININPTFPITYNNLGIAFREKGEYEAAINAFIAAIDLKSDYLPAYENLADSIKKLNLLNARVLRYLGQAFAEEQIRPESKRRILVLLGYIIESPREWNQSIFEKCILPETQKALNRSDHLFAYYLDNLTTLSYTQQPHTRAQWRVSHECTNPMYISEGEKLRKTLDALVLPDCSVELPIIGFILDLSVCAGSGETLLINLWKGFSTLKSLLFRTIVYTLTAASKETRTVCSELGIKLVDLSVYLGMLSSDKDLFQRLLVLRSHIQADKVTALIYPGTYESFPCLAASIGLAPVQIYLSMGFHSIHVPKMDGYASFTSAVKSKRMFDGKFWRTGPASSPDLYPEVDTRAMAEINVEVRHIRDKHFAPDAIILGSLCRPQKINHLPFIKMIASVLLANPKAVFLWFGPKEHPSIRLMMEEQGILERCLFQGWVDIKIYAKLLDIHLDTFPYANGLSMLDTLSASTASVCMDLETVIAYVVSVIRGELGSKEEQERLSEIFTHPKTGENLALCANSTDEYVAFVQRLIDDEDYRTEVGKAGRHFMVSFRHDPCVAAGAFAEHFIEIINEFREKSGDSRE